MGDDHKERLAHLMHELPRDKWGHPILPKPENIPMHKYERELLALQIELVKMQTWARDNNERVLIVFEGRDSAGKGGTIQRMREHLNPRWARHVALATPTDVEKGQWYFQRYVEQLPSHGEITFFDRSWYNRAGVERVMGFATDEQIDLFFEQVVPFEQFLVNDGIHLVKIWLSISQDEQVRRLASRRADPLKQWKVSPIDKTALKHWKAYSRARDAMLSRSHSAAAPWIVVRADDKKLARLNLIRDLLSRLEYDGKAKPSLLVPDRRIVFSFDAEALRDGRLAA